MQAFDELLVIADRLHGPDGCPWDHKQTFFSLQPYVLEEAHEVVEAVDGQNDEEIIEFLSLENLPHKTEEEIASECYLLAQIAERSNIDLEGAIRRKLAECKQAFLAQKE